ncbi:hypothetical protein F4561_003612 [Lipingzhangella halophila]|uniref:prolyl oligopeptidase n=1 Tax=Lipingzhangella halophila TaxID=1783352 RepID=A0A7W7RIU9_9ACTN|nr:prolyl oligopeptidase family serine peptidase [Lipingzhangella halophila]MBB4932792.1 hypothetical protein [Lipingzhangella halophila]
MTSGPPYQTSPALDAALARWERHARPGLPHAGYSLSRLAGRTRYGIYRFPDQTPVLEPDEHILRMAPSPDGARIAFQLADTADEDAVLGIVDAATGELRRYPDIRCRYDEVLWQADSSRLEVAASGSGRLVDLDPVSGERRESGLPPGVRVRLFRGGRRGLAAQSRPGRPTELIDRATLRTLGTFPGIVRVLPWGDAVLVQDGTGLQALHVASATVRWRWADPGVGITSLAAHGDDVLIAGVREGRSVLLRLAEGRVVEHRPVRCGGGPAVASGVAYDAGAFHALVEGPTLPPRLVAAEELLTGRAAAPQRMDATRTTHLTVPADDGAEVTVVLTSPKDAEGPAPLILTCYGGFGVPSLPEFEPTVPAWTEHGGRYAIAQIRGGGEHGTAWRRAGRGHNKQRGIADLAAAARGLVDAGLTRADLLILAGASHGGVIVTACALAEPGLCAGVVSTAAPLDLLNLDAHPLGRRWIGEFGDPGTAEGRARLEAVSPLSRAENLAPGIGPPAFLGIVLDEDSRVAADDTDRLVTALRRIGGTAELWRAPRTGHGGNHLDSLHRLGATILGFAEQATGSGAPRPTPAAPPGTRCPDETKRA